MNINLKLATASIASICGLSLAQEAPAVCSTNTCTPIAKAARIAAEQAEKERRPQLDNIQQARLIKILEKDQCSKPVLAIKDTGITKLIFAQVIPEPSQNSAPALKKPVVISIKKDTAHEEVIKLLVAANGKAIKIVPSTAEAIAPSQKFAKLSPCAPALKAKAQSRPIQFRITRVAANGKAIKIVPSTAEAIAPSQKFAKLSPCAPALQAKVQTKPSQVTITRVAANGKAVKLVSTTAACRKFEKLSPCALALQKEIKKRNVPQILHNITEKNEKVITAKILHNSMGMKNDYTSMLPNPSMNQAVAMQNRRNLQHKHAISQMHQAMQTLNQRTISSMHPAARVQHKRSICPMPPTNSMPPTNRMQNKQFDAQKTFIFRLNKEEMMIILKHRQNKQN